MVNKSIIVAHQITTGFNYEEEEQVKKKILLIPLALLLAISLVAIGCPAAPPEAPPEAPPPPPPPVKDKIVVGMSRSISGPAAMVEASAFRPIYETWVPEVNARGGIYVEEYGKKLPIEAIIYDDKTDTGTMVRLMEKLILEDKVDFLFPPVGTSFLFAAGPIANKYGYIFLGAEGGCTTVTDMLPELPYVFATLNYSDHYQLPVLADLFEDWGVKTVAIIYIADLHGVEYSGVAAPLFALKGIDVKLIKSAPEGIKDLSPILKEAQALEVDALCSFQYPGENFLAIGQLMEIGYNPKAFICGPGANFGFYHTVFGPAVEGVTCFAVANRETSPELKELYDKLYTGKPEDIQDWWGHPYYWASLDIWKAAVEQAGAIDQKKVRDIIATTTLDTVLGPTWFTMFGDGGGLMAKECHPGEIGQWQNGVLEIVGGNITTAPFVYPKPAWPAPPPE